MKVNQQISLPKIQESSENVNSSQKTTSSTLPFQEDSFELANSEFSSRFDLANESLGDEMKEVRNAKEDYQSKFRELSEKEQQAMEELTNTLKILSQMRRF